MVFILKFKINCIDYVTENYDEAKGRKSREIERERRHEETEDDGEEGREEREGEEGDSQEYNFKARCCQS